MTRHGGPVIAAAVVAALLVACAGGEPDERSIQVESPSPASTGAASTVPELPVAEAFVPDPVDEGTVGPELPESAADRFDAFVEAQGDGPDAALIEFALSVGPVDGVDTSAIGPRDASWEDSFSSALLSVETHWDAFTHEQRDALARRFIEHLVGPIGDRSAPDGERDGDAGTATSVQGFARPGRPLGASAGGDPELAAWQLRLRDAESWLASQLGIVGALDVELVLRTGTRPSGATAPSFGTAIDGHLATFVREFYDVDIIPRDIACSIRIVDASSLDEASKRSVIAHELFHCFSMTHLGLAPHRQTRKWVQEGLANWVGETYVGGSRYQAHRWNQYLEGGPLAATWNLYAAEYSAFPFWSTVHAMTGDLWSHIRSILEASRGSDAATYEFVLSLLSPQQEASIASAAANRPSLGDAWLQTGPGVPGFGRGSLAPQELVGGETITWSTPVGSQSNRTLRIGEASGWLVVDVGASGAARWAWTGGGEQVVANASWRVSYCVGGPCACPDGTPAADDLVDASGELVLATTGASTRTDATVRVLTEDDLCAPDCADPAAAAPAGFARPSAPAPVDECLALDPCVVGTWIADPDQTAAFALVAFRFAPVTPTFAGGTLRFEFADDGTFREVAEDIRLTVSIEGITGEQVYDRVVTGTWSVTADGLLATVPTSQVVDGQQLIAGIPAPPFRLEAGPDEVMAAEFTYACSDAELALRHDTATAMAFPERWTRAG